MSNETKVLASIFAVTAVIIGIGVWFMSQSQSSNLPSNNVQGSEELIKADSVSRGPVDAKVTVVEFGDFQCPACAQAAPILEKLMAEYDGRVRFVYRHFPLSQHRHAMKSAEAAEASNDQGKFWEMYQQLFTKQSEWEAMPKDKAEDTFRQYASQLGLDLTKFNESFNKDTHKNKISQDSADGSSLGVNSTPTFFINGEKQINLRGYEDFKAKIEAGLK